MNRLVMNGGKVTQELPPMPEQPKPQHHVWYLVRGIWYPVSAQMAKRKGYAFQEEEPDGKRCEDWERRIDVINSQAQRYGH